jgi:hypothetical protein
VIKKAQLAKIAHVLSAIGFKEAEALIKYNMGRDMLDWSDGNFMLNCLSSGILYDAHSLLSTVWGNES